MECCRHLHCDLRSASRADILEDPAIKAKFQEVVAASVRQQLEALASGSVSLPGALAHQRAEDRSSQQVSNHDHRGR
jgi:hypothetical protein